MPITNTTNTYNTTCKNCRKFIPREDKLLPTDAIPSITVSITNTPKSLQDPVVPLELYNTHEYIEVFDESADETGYRKSLRSHWELVERKEPLNMMLIYNEEIIYERVNKALEEEREV